MKTVETIKTGKNFTAVSVGKLNEIKDYVLPMGDIEIPGKVFVGQALQATGSELSFQVLVPNQIFSVSEGSIIRVAPNGKRALKNTGKDEMLMLCIQYKANSFAENDSPAGDGVILNDKLTW